MKKLITLVVVGLLLVAAAPALAAYTITVAPSATTISVGGCLYFVVTVTQNGSPVSGVSVGVDDPVREVCATAGTTNSQGKVTYYVEQLCPAQYNCKVGLFRFTFYAGSNSTTSQIKVDPSNPWEGQKFVVTNSGSSTYKVNVVLNGANKGTTTVPPGSNICLLSQAGYGNANLTATVMNTSGTTLWQAICTSTPSNSPQQTSFLNPHYSNYQANTTVRLNGTTRNRVLRGVGQIYNDVASGQWVVGGYNVSASDNVTHGVSSSEQLGITGPGCKTFLGLKVGCNIMCGASAGVQLCFIGLPLGPSIPIGPVRAGCTASCCVKVATVQCSVLDASFSAQTQWVQ